jgi:hypothetical protein
LGAVQLRKPSVTAWSVHVYDAYLSGAWLLIWTVDALFWVERPTVATETINGRKQLHNAIGPALACDVENLYFWHGVLVPAFVVVRPEWITAQHIDHETNAEVRRIMLDRIEGGRARYMRETNTELVHSLPDNYFIKGLQGAKLYRKERTNDEPLIMLTMQNSTPEPDGSIKEYMLQIDPDAYGGLSKTDCHAAMASTYRYEDDGGLVFKKPQDYRPGIES